MNRLVTWGHWPGRSDSVGQEFGTLYEIVRHFPRAWHDSTVLTYPTDYFMMGRCAFYFVCAWGLLNWSRWAYVSTLALSLSELGVFAMMVAMDWSAALETRSIALWSALNGSVLAWLVLPSVRSNYRRSQQAA